MTTRAGIIPHLTNHSIRATTVTVLSAANIESRHIKAITGHQSKAIIQSYCDTPTFKQFKTMSNKLGEFFDPAGNENNAVAVTHSAVVPPPAPSSQLPSAILSTFQVEISLFSSPFKTAHRILHVASFLEASSTTAVLISM